MNSNLEDV